MIPCLGFFLISIVFANICDYLLLCSLLNFWFVDDFLGCSSRFLLSIESSVISEMIGYGLRRLIETRSICVLIVF